ncbi:uncharacterized protein N7496_010667 [Penicillium cataractarum]|uniref:Erythromycin esterase n=1 Tax=Penicillium cataractarum TaxID=2100454 RepID=A0A9W9RTZ4_9EURO|nr:uncharacterized protein N7496_010667 [Penicillium cataractarum]KAJ5364954.1 hypothetical protein N7496_010667 [Penicillium cataractarum]
MTPIQELFNRAIEPLPAIEEASFASHFDRFADRQVVLLGDGSHGTSEHYRARAEITKRFIERHGYTIVAVEADWPDAELIDRYVRLRPSSAQSSEPFKRFPTWMWRNCEMRDLIQWMRKWNETRPPDRRVGFYGLDLYSMSVSIQSVIDYLNRVDPAAAKEAKKRYSCLDPWVDDPAAYGLAALRGMRDCELFVTQMLSDLLKKRLDYIENDVLDGEEYESGKQNAFLVRDAERYYKAMYWSSASSWTLRDTHMFDTLVRLLQHCSPSKSGPNPPSNCKAIVWAHNSHVGDARYTSMGLHRGELNIGQLCREHLGHKHVAILGCGTHTGTVAAAHEWDGDLEIMTIRPSRPDSWEMIAHKAGVSRFLLDLRHGHIDPALHRALSAENRLERFVGVIYRPDTERLSHYSQAFMHGQFDGYIWFDCTEAIKPLRDDQSVITPGASKIDLSGI